VATPTFAFQRLCQSTQKQAKYVACKLLHILPLQPYSNSRGEQIQCEHRSVDSPLQIPQGFLPRHLVTLAEQKARSRLKARKRWGMSMPLEPRKAKRRKPDESRVALRDSLWPWSWPAVWDRRLHDGYATVPRILPLMFNLLGEMCPKANPTRVYASLWCRNTDQGIITISDLEMLAFESGYTGTRATRTCREHLQKLKELGVIKVASHGNREFGHVLMINPLIVFAVKRNDSKVSDELWQTFVTRAFEIGAVIPKLEDIPRQVSDSR
jgi:hypothetical protein